MPRPPVPFAVEVTLHWQSTRASHADAVWIPAGGLLLPEGEDALAAAMLALAPGESTEWRFPPGSLVPAEDAGRCVRFAPSAFCPPASAPDLRAQVGRFYPQGLAPGAFPHRASDAAPFRLIGMEAGAWMGDANHPLAAYPLRVRIERREAPGGPRAAPPPRPLAAWATAGGPGMQAAHAGAATEFFSPYPFRRASNVRDADFYGRPRRVHHLDASCRLRLRDLYSSLLPPAAAVLDLMASWHSHLPEQLALANVTGLGMNAEELEANPRLMRRVVHDLNETPNLPFADGAFDAVVCTASIEYLLRPLEVVAEVARVLRPGGRFITAFSDRWFPGRQIEPWADLHPFERLGFVLALYDRTGAFDALHTATLRGLPRPADDPHIARTRLSDPLYAVWGTRL